MPDTDRQLLEKISELEKLVAVLYQRAIDADKAVVMATDTLGRRLDEMNQFRAQINTERGEFVLKALFYAKQDEQDRKIDVLTQAKSNMEGRLWALGVGITAMVVVVNLLFKWLLK